MQFAVVLALVAFAAATSHSRIPNSGWLREIVKDSDYEVSETGYRTDREYRYIYNGQLASGIPQSSKQHSATRIQSVVSIVFKGQDTALLKLTHIRMGQLNRVVPNPRAILPFEAYEEATISEELHEKLRLPVKFKYIGGLIKDIVFDGAEQPWSANVKRAVLNMLQVNVKQHGRTDMSEEQLLLNGPKEPIDPHFDFFTVQERTLEGDCEVHYTITKQPDVDWNGRTRSQQVLNVTKSINFEKCRQRPDIRYNFRFGEECASCERKFAMDETNLQSSTVARYNITGTLDEFLIESAVVASQYIFAPINEQSNVIATYVNQSLVLFQAGKIKTEVSEPRNPINSDSQMVYTPDWDIMKEQFFMNGDNEFLDKTPYSDIKSKVEFVEQIIRRLARLMSDESQGIEQQAPRQLSRLVKALRMCTEAELREIHSKLYDNADNKIEDAQQKKIKDVLVDAMALAGTKNTIQHLVEDAKAKKVHPVKVALALKSLIHARTVSEKQVELVLDLCKSQVAERSAFLKQSCYLTVGSMMNAMCDDDNADQLAVDVKKTSTTKRCPRALKQKYIDELFNLFKSASNKYERILALKTIANAGLDLSIFELEKIIKNVDREHSVVVRSQAVDALRQMRFQMPRKIQKILMPIFKNKYEPIELRMNAVARIMQTLPERPILDQIAQQLFQERSFQVQSFVFTLLQSYANSTQPCERRMAQDLQLSLRHGRKVPSYRVLTSSKYLHIPFINRKMNLGTTFKFGSIMTNGSIVPKELMVALNTMFMGQWTHNMIQFGFVQQNADELIERLLYSQGLLAENSVQQLLTRGRRSAAESNEQAKSMLKNIFKKLNISPRRSRNQQPTAMLYMRYKDQDYAMLPLDWESLPESVQSMVTSNGARASFVEIERFLRQGYHMDFHTAAFMTEKTRKIPTSLGFPLEVSLKMPTIASIKGHVKLALSDNGRQVKLQVDATPKVATSLVVRVECWTPIVNSGVKVMEAIQLNLPIKTEIEVDVERTELKMTFKAPKEQKRIFAIQSFPVSYTRVWPKLLTTYVEPQEKTIHGEEWNRVQTIDKQFGKHAFGVEFGVHGQWKRSPSKVLTGTPAGPFAGPSQINVYLRPGNEAPEEIHVKVGGELFGELKENLQPSMEQFYEQDLDKDFFCDDECDCNADQDSSESVSKSSSVSAEKSNSGSSSESGSHSKSVSQSGSKSSSESESAEKKEKNGDTSCECRRSCAKQFTGFNNYHSNFRTSGGRQHRLSVKVETVGGSTQRKAELALKSQCGKQLRLCKWQLELVRTPIPQQESQPWELTAHGQYLYPKVPYTLAELAEQEQENGNDEHDKFNAKLEAKWGEKGQRQQYVHVRVQGGRGEEQIELLKQGTYQKLYNKHQDSEIFSPVSQYEQLVRAAALTEYKVAVDYKVSTYLRNITNKVFRYIKYNQYDNADVNEMNVNNPANKIYMTMSVDPRSYRFVNVSASLPDQIVRITDMRLPVKALPLNIRRYPSPSAASFIEMLTDQTSVRPKCTVSSSRVETFDQVHYRVPITTCYSVLAKDCAGYDEQPKFVVMMKKISKNNEAKKVKIVTPKHIIELIAKKDKYARTDDSLVEVKVDGRVIEVPKEDSVQMHDIELICEGPYIKVRLQHVATSVYFDGYTCSIKTTPMMMNAQCGLCGDYDGERSGDLRAADEDDNDDSDSEEQLQRFHRSYLNKDDEECEMDEQAIGDRQQYRHEPLFAWEKNRKGADRDEYDSDDSDERVRSNSEEQWTPRRDSSSSSESAEQSGEVEIAKPYRQGSLKPRELTKVIEYSSEICFSKKPVPECPDNSYAEEYEQEEKKMPFCCVSRTDPQAHTLQRLVRQQRIVDTQNLKPSVVEAVLIPKRCKLF